MTSRTGSLLTIFGSFRKKMHLLKAIKILGRSHNMKNRLGFLQVKSLILLQFSAAKPSFMRKKKSESTFDQFINKQNWNNLFY